MIAPTIDPSAPCVDFDSGRYRGSLYLCLNGQWDRLDVTGEPTP